jgi:hypothetical protein
MGDLSSSAETTTMALQTEDIELVNNSIPANGQSGLIFDSFPGWGLNLRSILSFSFSFSTTLPLSSCGIT